MSLSALAQLPARPPTPPTSNNLNKGVDDALSFLGSTIGSPTRHSLVTPPQSSPSSHDCRPTKRIRFESKPSYYEDPFLDIGRQKGSLSSSGHKSLPKVPKSILKSVEKDIISTPSTSDASQQLESPSGSKHLQHVFARSVKQLGSSDFAVKIETYNDLFNSLKTLRDPFHARLDKENIGEDTLISQDQLSLVESFLRKDISGGGEKTSPENLTLSKQALKVAFVMFAVLGEGVTKNSADFVNWLADYLLAVIASSDVTKAVLKSHLTLFEIRSFSERVLKPDRTRRLLASLEDSDHRFKGDSLNGTRLTIYQRLLELHPELMLNKIKVWIPHVFHGLLSRFDVVQQRAVTTGTKAANVFGSGGQACQALRDFLEQPASDGKTNFDHVEAHMNLMLSHGKQDSIVPSIWSLVIVFQRYDHNLHRWSRWASWQKLIQRCFNCANSTVNINAFHAWNRLVYAVSPGSDSRPNAYRVLRQPVTGYFRRSENSKAAMHTNDAAFATYRLLLYYGFRPTTLHENTTLAWTNLVLEVIPKFPTKKSRDAYEICKILSTLLFDSRLQNWSVRKVTQGSKDPIDVGDIPRIEPNWTRKNINQILSTLESCLASDWTLLAKDMSEAPQLAVWKALLNAILEAGSKEIIISSDFRNAVTEIIATIHRIQSLSLGKESQESGFDKQLCHQCWLLSSSALKILGPNVFVERCSISSDQNVAKSSLAPQKPSHPPPFEMPLLKILKPSYFSDILGYPKSAVDSVLRSCLGGISQPRDKLALLDGFTKSFFSNDKPDASKASNDLWNCAVEETISALCNLSGYFRKSGTQPSPGDVDVAVSVLRLGASRSSRQCAQGVESLYNCLCSCMKRVGGNKTIIWLLIEPLHHDIKMLEKPGLFEDCTLLLLACMVKTIFLLPNEILLEDSTPNRIHPWEHEFLNWSFESFWNTVRDSLTRSFNSLYPVSEDDLCTLLGAVTASIDSLSSSPMLRERLLQLLSPALVSIIEAPTRFHSNLVLNARILDAWTQLLQLFEQIPGHANEVAGGHYKLLCAGFQTHNRVIAFETMKSWNRKCGSSGETEYRDELLILVNCIKKAANLDIFVPKEISIDNYLDEPQRILHWLGTNEDQNTLLLESNAPTADCKDRLSEEGVRNPEDLTNQQEPRDWLPIPAATENEHHAPDPTSDEDFTSELRSSPTPAPRNVTPRHSEESASPRSKSKRKTKGASVDPSEFVVSPGNPSLPHTSGISEVVSGPIDNIVFNSEDKPSTTRELTLSAREPHNTLNLAHAQPQLTSDIADESASVPNVSAADNASDVAMTLRRKNSSKSSQEQMAPAQIPSKKVIEHTGQQRKSPRDKIPVVYISSQISMSDSAKEGSAPDNTETVVERSAKRRRLDRSASIREERGSQKRHCSRATPQQRRRLLMQSNSQPQNVSLHYKEAERKALSSESMIVVSTAKARRSGKTAFVQTQSGSSPPMPTSSTKRKRNSTNADTDNEESGQTGHKKQKTIHGQSKATRGSRQGLRSSRLESPNAGASADNISRRIRRSSTAYSSKKGEPKNYASARADSTGRKSRRAGIEHVKVEAGTEDQDGDICRDFEEDQDTGSFNDEDQEVFFATPNDRRNEDDMNGSTSRRSSIMSSPGSLARNIAGRLRNLIWDASSLVLGTREQDGQRRELEDLGFGLQRALNDAGRRARR